MGDRTDEALARLPAVHRAIEAIPLPGADHTRSWARTSGCRTRSGPSALTKWLRGRRS